MEFELLLATLVMMTTYKYLFRIVKLIYDDGYLRAKVAKFSFFPNSVLFEFNCKNVYDLMVK